MTPKEISKLITEDPDVMNILTTEDGKTITEDASSIMRCLLRVMQGMVERTGKHALLKQEFTSSDPGSLPDELQFFPDYTRVWIMKWAGDYPWIIGISSTYLPDDLQDEVLAGPPHHRIETRDMFDAAMRAAEVLVRIEATYNRQAGRLAGA
jgi:hypothetical protein